LFVFVLTYYNSVIWSPSVVEYACLVVVAAHCLDM